MDLNETLRTTGAVRQFHPEPIEDEVLHRMLDTARFAPSGGNRQGWRVIIVKDPDKRRQLRDLYVSDWYKYLALAGAGLVPWAPVSDRQAEAAALANAPALADAAAASPPGFAESLDTAPALLLILADLSALAAVDRDHSRYTFAGGASIYPFVWSLLLTARSEGLAGVMTTIAIRREDDVKALFEVPETCAVAALVVLGRPVTPIRRLRRSPVEDFAWVDRYRGSPLGGT
jgi:nitroreductase